MFAAMRFAHSQSLMGTNFVEYLVEAHRVLRKHGLLRIAEVRLRVAC